MFDKLAEYRKAIAGFITPGIVVVIASLAPASDGGAAITLSEWLYVALAILGTGSIVAAVPNAVTQKQKIALALRTSSEVNADTQAALAKAGLPPTA